MKNYYEFHEEAYKKLKENGALGWGGKKTIAELGDSATKDYLKTILQRYFKNPTGLKALDIGTGSGVTAFEMAKIGFQVTGVDISVTAIEMAQELAQSQNIKIDFIQADIMKLSQLDEKFDLIYDSHCMHCIVFDEDRMQIFKEIKKTLSPAGYFVLDTMAYCEGFDPVQGNQFLRFDDQFILWHKTKPSTDRGVVVIGEQHWCAQRRVYPVAKIKKEIAQAGFQIVSEVVDIQKEKDPLMLRLVLK